MAPPIKPLNPQPATQAASYHRAYLRTGDDSYLFEEADCWSRADLPQKAMEAYTSLYRGSAVMLQGGMPVAVWSMIRGVRFFSDLGTLQSRYPKSGAKELTEQLEHLVKTASK